MIYVSAITRRFITHANLRSRLLLYIATPKQWKDHNDAAVKLDFWHQNLLKLEQDLAKFNVKLHFFQVESYKQVPDLVATICQQWSIKQLHFNEEYPVNECQRGVDMKACRLRTLSVFKLLKQHVI